MPDTKEMLALELRQIIQADRMAADIIRDAQQTQKSIEKNTEKVKADILTSLEKCQAEIEEDVRNQQQQILAARKAELEKQINSQQQKLEQQVEEHRDAWVDGIVNRVTQA